MAKEVIEIDVKTNISGAKSLSDLKSEFKELQKELSGLEQGSEQYIQTLRRLGEVKDDIGDLRSEIEGFAGADKKFAAIGNVVGGLANGFQAAQGAAALFGADNEVLNETMVKLQATMALTQGIQGLAGMGDSLKVVGSLLKSTTLGTQLATVAQRVYNAVMAANPIGLLIAGLTALVGVIALVVNAMEDENEAQKKIIASREKDIETLKRQKEALDNFQSFESNLAKARGATLEQTRQLEDRQHKERIEKLRELKAKTISQIDDISKLQLTSSGDELKKLTEQKNKLIDEEQKYFNEILKLSNDYTIREAQRKTDDAKAEEERRKAAAEKARQEAEKKRQKDLEDAEKWRQEQAKFIQYELDAFANKFGEEEQIIAEQQLATKIALGIATPDEVEAYQKEINARKLKAEKEYNDAVDAELKRLKEIADKRRADEDAKIKAEYELRLKGFQQLELQKVEWAKQGLTLISELNTLFAGKSEAEQRRAFEIDKGVKLASATMSGIEGTINAYKTAQASPITAVFPAYPAIQAGIAATFAAINVAKIAQTKFASTEKAQAPQSNNLGTFSQGGGVQAPALTAQNNVTQLNPDGSVAGQGNREMQPVKAYVVESESRAVTDRINKLSNQSKIG
jgi:hypothetical protein